MSPVGIIFTILGGLLVTVLILVTVILSVPFRWGLVVDTTDPDETADLSITYLRRLLRIRIQIAGGQPHIRVWLLHRKLYDMDEHVRQSTAKKKKSRDKKTARKRTKRQEGESWLEYLGGKVEELTDRILSIRDEIEQSPYKRGIYRALRRFGRHLCRALRFRRGEFAAHFGTGDPYQTSTYWGLLCAISPFVTWKHLMVEVEPNFQEKRFDAKGSLQGVFIVRTFIGALLGLAANHSVWQELISIIGGKKTGRHHKKKQSAKSSSQEHKTDRKMRKTA